MAIEYIPFIPKGSNALITSDFLTFHAKYPTGLTLYQCAAEDNRVDKIAYLTEVLNIDGTFRQECDVIRPSVFIEIYSLPQFNYVHVAEFNRYYFVRSFSTVQQRLWKVELEVDVLFTYRQQIRSLSAFVERNETRYNPLLRDALRPFENEPQHIILKDDEHSPFNVGDVTPTLHPGTGELQIYDKAYRYVINGIVDQGDIFKYPATTMPINFASNHIAIVNAYQFAGTLLELVQRNISDVTTLWEGSPTGAINSLMIYPFDVAEALHLTEADYTSTIKLGATTLTRSEADGWPGGDTQGYIARENAAEYSRMFIGAIDLTGYGTEWYEFDSKMQIYLPFFGFKEIDPHLTLGKWVNIYCLVDYNDGTGTYYISADDVFTGTSKLLSIDTCTLAIQIPMGYDQASGQTFKSVLGGVVAGVSAATTGNVMPVVSAMGDIITSFAPQMVIGGTYKGSAWTASEGPMHVECHILMPSPVINSNYGMELGFPLMERVTLDTLTGFTEIGEVHLEGFSTATTEEKQKIESLLKGGVIF